MIKLFTPVKNIIFNKNHHLNCTYNPLHKLDKSNPGWRDDVPTIPFPASNDRVWNYLFHDFVLSADAVEAIVLAAIESKIVDTILHFPGPENITP